MSFPGARHLYLKFDPRCSSQYDYDKVSLSHTYFLFFSCQNLVLFSTSFCMRICVSLPFSFSLFPSFSLPFSFKIFHFPFLDSLQYPSPSYYIIIIIIIFIYRSRCMQVILPPVLRWQSMVVILMGLVVVVY